MNNSSKGIILATFTALMWGLLAIALKVILAHIPPLTVTWFRFFLAFLFLFLYYLIFNRKGLSILLNPPKLAIIAALFLGLNYIGFIVGIKNTTPVIAQIFIQMGPVLLAVAGFVIFHETLSLRQTIGFIIVVLGLALFYYEKIEVLAGGAGAYRTGVFWILFGAIAWAGYAIYQKKAVEKSDPMELNLILFGLPALLLFPFVSFHKFTSISPIDWWVLIFTGLNTMGAYVALSYAFKYLEANKISVIITLNPLITVFLMYLLLVYQVNWIEPEVYSTSTLIGAAIVILGVIMTVWKKRIIRRS